MNNVYDIFKRYYLQGHSSLIKEIENFVEERKTNAYNKGRADCLQESLDLKKQLLPHELKLIARLLDYAAGEFSVNDIPDTFKLDDTQRHRDLKVDIANWFKMGPEMDRSKDWDRDLMSYMAHRVREALTEEES